MLDIEFLVSERQWALLLMPASSDDHTRSDVFISFQRSPQDYQYILILYSSVCRLVSAAPRVCSLWHMCTEENLSDVRQTSMHGYSEVYLQCKIPKFCSGFMLDAHLRFLPYGVMCYYSYRESILLKMREVCCKATA